jgi:hypothetical protein
MRLSVIRAFAIATVATMALAACANQNGMVPSSPSAMAPTTAQAPATAQRDTSADDADAQDAATPLGAALPDAAMSPLALKTCATSPPQYEWIFKGACQIFSMTSSGAHFSLGEYQSITVKGLIGKNTAKGSVKIALADAIDKKGDIEADKGKAFPAYKANGTTYVYASAVNQSTQVIKPVTVKGKPVLQYVITDAKGFGDSNMCAAAVLTFKDGKSSWKSLPATGIPHGKTVTISQYNAPAGFELPPKTPLYFAVNCYKQ